MRASRQNLRVIDRGYFLALYLPQVVPKSPRARAIALTAVLSCVASVLMPVLFKLDGKSHGDWLQFLGRFHPMLVHLPIGFLLPVPLLELAGRIRPALREAAGWILWLTAPACVVATIPGFLLAYGSGDAGVRVTRHMWGGIALTIIVALSAGARSAWSSGMTNRIAESACVALLSVAVGLMLWVSHQGGSLTHGDQYLTEHAPATLKRWPAWLTPRVEEPAAPGSFYAMQIHPILEANCASCHGASKVKGKLRLDSYARLMRGGAVGAGVIPGNPDRSLLFQRITLPKDHKKFMPSERKPPLNPREIAMIRAWIADGASPIAVSVKGFSGRASETVPPIQVLQDPTKASKKP